jgi:hypothetical protein
VLVDVSDPAQPRQVGVYQHAPDTFNQGELALADALVYCTTLSGLVSVDISDPRKPRLVKQIELGGKVTDVVVLDGYAFVAAGPQGVIVLDVQDPAAPRRVGQYSAGKTFAAAQIAVRPIGDREASRATARYLVYVANTRGPGVVLQFGTPAANRDPAGGDAETTCGAGGLRMAPERDQR